MLWASGLCPRNAFCIGCGREQCLGESLAHALSKHVTLEYETGPKMPPGAGYIRQG